MVGGRVVAVVAVVAVVSPWVIVIAQRAEKVNADGICQGAELVNEDWVDASALCITGKVLGNRRSKATSWFLWRLPEIFIKT